MRHLRASERSSGSCSDPRRPAWLHHADLPLFVVPRSEAPLDGPWLAGYDDSDGAREALRFFAGHVRHRSLVVAHVWRSPVRHTRRGQALVHSGIDTFADHVETVDRICAEAAQETAEGGVAYARGIGLTAVAAAPESRARRVAGAARPRPRGRRRRHPRRLAGPRRGDVDGARLRRVRTRARCGAARARRARAVSAWTEIEIGSRRVGVERHGQRRNPLVGGETNDRGFAPGSRWPTVTLELMRRTIRRSRLQKRAARADAAPPRRRPPADPGCGIW